MSTLRARASRLEAFIRIYPTFRFHSSRQTIRINLEQFFQITHLEFFNPRPLDSTHKTSDDMITQRFHDPFKIRWISRSRRTLDPPAIKRVCHNTLETSCVSPANLKLQRNHLLRISLNEPIPKSKFLHRLQGFQTNDPAIGLVVHSRVAVDVDFDVDLGQESEV